MDSAGWDESQLVQRCKQGSEAAFAELVRRHRPRLFALAFRLTGDRDTAEDVVQETFVAAFRALDRFEPRPSLAAWLNTIALRNAGRTAAKVAARPRTSLDAVADDGTASAFSGAMATDVGDPHVAAEAAELRRELSAAVATLPFKYRAAVVTRYVLGLDYAEAAATLEMGLNTYKSHLLRGTRMLRDVLTNATPAAGSVHQPVIVPAPSPMRGASHPAPLGTSGVMAQAHRVASRTAFADTARGRFHERLPNEKPLRG